MTKVLIAAGGDGVRWGNHLGIPKHFLTVEGEPLIYRTARLFHERGCDVVVVGPDEDRYQNIPYTTWSEAQPQDGMGELNRFMCTLHEWSRDDRTVIVFGDVYFTEEAVATIDNTWEDWLWFGRSTKSDFTRKKWAEGFALSFKPHVQSYVRLCVLKALEAYEAGYIDRCIGWELYRTLAGKQGRDIRGRTPQHNLGNFVEIHDWTDDFDFPDDYSRFLELRADSYSVSILVPYRESDEYRKKIWEWIEARYRKLHPDWEVVVGYGDETGPWRKADALYDAFRRSSGDIVIPVDADTWCENLQQGVENLIYGASWVIPHDRYVRFNEEASEAILNGGSFHDYDRERHYSEKPYMQQAAASASILWRRTMERVPMDPRFEGWGGEDHAWMWALDTLVGKHTRVQGDIWHLWHPAQPRPNRKVGFKPNEDLELEYKDIRHDPEAMHEMVGKALDELGLDRQPYENLSNLQASGRIRRVTIRNRRGYAIRRGGITFQRRSERLVVVNDLQYRDIKTDGGLMVVTHHE